MPTEPLLSNDLLDPIMAEQPAGADLRWTADWDRIKEARRADDGLETGNWAKKERKVADWRQVEELATAMLRDRSKDLQLAVWLMEARAAWLRRPAGRPPSHPRIDRPLLGQRTVPED
jgi:predicted component of type VI protein secretion system